MRLFITKIYEKFFFKIIKAKIKNLEEKFEYLFLVEKNKNRNNLKIDKRDLSNTNIISKLPKDFDGEIFLQLKPTLNNSDQHYKEIISSGENNTKLKGEIFSDKFYSKEDFLSLLEPYNSILEIGCFDRPSIEKYRLRGEKIISYADWFSKKELQNRADRIKGRNKNNVPDIKYVLSDGYQQIDFNYEAIISNHCIEHQPDLIAHINQIYEIVKNKGRYFFSVPNKYFCFDHFIPESTILDAILAHYEKRRKPSLKSVLEHRAFTSHNWIKEENPFKSLDLKRLQLYKNAVSEFSENDYCDVHCWQFTPESLQLIFSQLDKLGLIKPIKSLEIYCNIEEFYVALKFI